MTPIDTGSMKIMIYNTQPEDEQIDQIVTSLISWNERVCFFKRYDNTVVSPYKVGWFGVYHELSLDLMADCLKQCVLYVSGHKARYGREVKIPSKICKVVRDSSHLLDSLPYITESEKWKLYAIGV